MWRVSHEQRRPLDAIAGDDDDDDDNDGDANCSIRERFGERLPFASVLLAPVVAFSLSISDDE